MDRRRAERFAELLNEAETGRRRRTTTAHDEDLRPLVDLGRTLAEASRDPADESVPRPEFAADLRQRLLAVAAVRGLGSESEAPPSAAPVPSRGRRRLVVAGALAALVFGLTGVSTASGDALPGEALYPVKRSTERAQLALAGSDVSRGQLHFEFARTRLDEAGKVVADADAVSTALDDMDDEIRRGMQELTTAAVDRADPGVLDLADGFLTAHRPDVAALRDDVPESSRAEIAESIDLIDAAAARVDELRLGLPCTDTGEDLRVDSLGALPGRCDAQSGPVDGGTFSTSDSEPSAGDGTGSPSPSEPDDPGSVGTPPSASPSEPEEDDDEDDDRGLLGEIGDILSGLFG